MAQATPKARFMPSKSGKVHVITTKANDLKTSACTTVKTGWTTHGWKGHRGISPESALDLDHCKRCDVTGWANLVIEATKTPEQKRADRKEAQQATLDRASGKQAWYVSANGRGWTSNPDMAKKDEHGVPMTSVLSKDKPKRKPTKVEATQPGGKAPKQSQQPKVNKPVVPTKTKSGMRSVGGQDAKVKALAMFAQDNGWSAEIGEDEKTGHTVVTCVKGDQTIHAYFIDGKYDVARHAVLTTSNGWSGTLRGAHACRRQMDKNLDKRDRPHPEPGKGRKGPRPKRDEPDPPESESPEDASKRLPFSMDDPDVEIIDMLAGRRIRWRNTKSNAVQEAEIPDKRMSKKTRITKHPTSERRILNFIEVVYDDRKVPGLGGERSVALEKILRVI